MEFQIGDIVKLKKAHPCGINEWEILRVGMDFRLKCVGCGRQVMGIESVVIDENTDIRILKNELRWNEVVYR